MKNEREFLVALALTIGLAILPMTGWIYCSFAAALAALCARIAYLSLNQIWAKALGSTVAVTLVALATIPHAL